MNVNGIGLPCYRAPRAASRKKWSSQSRLASKLALNFEQAIVFGGSLAAVTADKEEHNFIPFMLEPLRDACSVAFRHEVMQDIERPEVFELIKSFAAGMHEVRRALGETQKRHYERQKECWFVDAAGLYGDAVYSLATDLSVANLSSRGLLAFREFIVRYASSEPFVELVVEANT
jgi:DNA mismatch repair protein MutS